MKEYTVLILAIAVVLIGLTGLDTQYRVYKLEKKLGSYKCA